MVLLFSHFSYEMKKTLIGKLTFQIICGLIGFDLRSPYIASRSLNITFF